LKAFPGPVERSGKGGAESASKKIRAEKEKKTTTDLEEESPEQSGKRYDQTQRRKVWEMGMGVGSGGGEVKRGGGEGSEPENPQKKKKNKKKTPKADHRGLISRMHDIEEREPEKNEPYSTMSYKKNAEVPITTKSKLGTWFYEITWGQKDRHSGDWKSRKKQTRRLQVSQENNNFPFEVRLNKPIQFFSWNSSEKKSRDEGKKKQREASSAAVPTHPGKERTKLSCLQK